MKNALFRRYELRKHQAFIKETKANHTLAIIVEHIIKSQYIHCPVSYDEQRSI